MKILILSWIPWSGKSTFRDEFIKINPNTLILSSDDIRDDLIQKNLKINPEFKIRWQVNPFIELYDRLEKEIINNVYEYIIFDATNISKKERRKVLNFIKNINTEIKIDLYAFYNDIFTTYDRIFKRTEEYKKSWINKEIYLHKFVNRNVVNKMLQRFDVPDINEWFDNIIIFNYALNLIIGSNSFNEYIWIDLKTIDKISNTIKNNINSINLYEKEYLSIIDINDYLKNNTIIEKQLYQFINNIRDIFYEILDLKLINSDEIKMYFNKLLNTCYYFPKYLWFEQTSKYHKETLDQHIYMMFEKFIKDYKENKYQEYFIKTKNNEELFFIKMIILIFFHDVWKLFTRNTKLNNLRWKWYKFENNTLFTKSWTPKKIDNLNDYQFLWHEKVSATIFFFEFAPILYKYFNYEMGIYSEETVDLINSLYWNIYNHLKYHDILKNTDNNSGTNTDLFIAKINETKLPYTAWYIDYYLWHYLEDLDNKSRIE